MDNVAGYPVWDRSGLMPLPAPPLRTTLTAVHSGKCLDVAAGPRWVSRYQGGPRATERSSHWAVPDSDQGQLRFS